MFSIRLQRLPRPSEQRLALCQKLAPYGPVRGAGVIERSEASAIGDERQFGRDVEEQIDDFEIGRRGPAGIVKGDATSVVPEEDRDLGFLQQELDNRGARPSAGDVQQRIAELVAAVQGGARSVKFPKRFEVVLPNSRGDLHGVGIDHLFGGFDEFVLRLRHNMVRARSACLEHFENKY